MEMKRFKKAQALISAVGLSVLAILFALWLRDRWRSPAEITAAFMCLALFALVCLRFVPRWLSLWFGESDPALPGSDAGGKGEIPLPALFAGGLGWAGLHYLAVWLILHYVNRDLTGGQYLDFWKSADAFHYLCIARDWYLSEGEIDRLVQLVFLPGYPIAVRLAWLVIRDYTVAGLAVSTFCFAGALCVIYRFSAAEYGREAAKRTVIFLCLMPGAFFFFAPMSESLFLLLSAACLYAMRRRRWLLAGLSGALAAFTRSLGLMLFVPLFFEWIAALLHGKRKWLPAVTALVLIPLGFGAYLMVNYFVAGNPFQFMIYQREHWFQNLGLFFNTAGYQTRYALAAAAQNGKDTLMGLWIPNLAAVFGSLLILLAGAGKLRASETAWAIAYYVIAVGATWLLSAPRYMAVLLPLPMALGQISGRKAVRYPLYTLFLLCGGYYLLMFALRYNVW